MASKVKNDKRLTFWDGGSALVTEYIPGTSTDTATRSYNHVTLASRHRLEELSMGNRFEKGFMLSCTEGSPAILAVSLDRNSVLGGVE